MRKIPSPIQLVNQDDDVSCSIACIAMVTGLDFISVRNEIKEHLELRPPMTSLAVAKALCHFGIYSLAENPISPFFCWGQIYFAAVKSLNVLGGHHHVIVDMRDGFVRIFDPQHGRLDRAFYTDKELGAMECIDILRLVELTS